MLKKLLGFISGVIAMIIVKLLCLLILLSSCFIFIPLMAVVVPLNIYRWSQGASPDPSLNFRNWDLTDLVVLLFEVIFLKWRLAEYDVSSGNN